MRIENLKLQQQDGKSRLSADISFEESTKKTLTVYFETSDAFSDFIFLGYEPFILAAFPVALYHKEKRIKIDGLVCAELLSNVKAAMLLQKLWFNLDQDIPELEVEEKTIYSKSDTDRNSAAFLSGGVDSLANLYRNISLYPSDHQHRIKYAICVYGLDMGDPNKRPCPEIFLETINLLKNISTSNGITLIPIYTNARDLEPNWLFYEKHHYGSLLSGISHALGNKINICSIALDNRIDYIHRIPHGSHPSLNRYFSSSLCSIISTLGAYKRIEKYSFFIDKPEALSALRVCYMINDIEEGAINCCRCAKCVRTKLELLVNGVLDQTHTFSDKSLTNEMVRQVKIYDGAQKEFIDDLIPALRKAGKNEFAEILNDELESYLAQGGFSIIDTLKNLQKKFFRARHKN